MRNIYLKEQSNRHKSNYGKMYNNTPVYKTVKISKSYEKVSHKPRVYIFYSYKLVFILALANITVIILLLGFMTGTSNQNANVALYMKQIAELNINNQMLENKIADAQKINNIESKARELGMVDIGNVEYLNSSNIISFNIQRR